MMSMKKEKSMIGKTITSGELSIKKSAKINHFDDDDSDEDDEW